MHSGKHSVLTFIFLTMSGFLAKAQDSYLPLNSITNYYIDRMDISGITPNLNTSIKPYLRKEISQGFMNKKIFDSLGMNLNFEERYFKDENIEFSNLYFPTKDSIGQCTYTWKRVYLTQAVMYAVQKKDLFLAINPIFGFSGGLANNQKTYQNSRGIEIRGSIDGKVGFYSSIIENQFRFPKYYHQIIDSTGTIPGIGFHKTYGKDGYDFFLAKGYLTCSPSKHIGIQFGHDQNFIGNGYRSLILSDFSNPYLFLKVNTKLWRFNYQNLFTQLTDFSFTSGNGSGMKPKYLVNHYLNVKLRNNLEIGIFESVVYDRSQPNQNGYFDVNYLNPIIFYRAVEHNLNSSDNVIVGADWKWNVKKKFSFYGQFVLDEFLKDSLFQRTGWWANKFGVQAGVKYIDAFSVKRLDLQLEMNTVRPYTYTHFKKSQNYVHYNQAVAHPFGANFKEIIFTARYNPGYKFFAEAGIIYTIKGLDSNSASKNFGGNILGTYDRRPYESGHFISQGVKTNYTMAFIHISYMLTHNLWIDTRANFRSVKSSFSDFESKTNWYQIGLRMNINMRNYDF